MLRRNLKVTFNIRIYLVSHSKLAIPRLVHTP